MSVFSTTVCSVPSPRADVGLGHLPWGGPSGLYPVMWVPAQGPGQTKAPETVRWQWCQEWKLLREAPRDPTNTHTLLPGPPRGHKASAHSHRAVTDGWSNSFLPMQVFVTLSHSEVWSTRKERLKIPTLSSWGLNIDVFNLVGMFVVFENFWTCGLYFFILL